MSFLGRALRPRSPFRLCKKLLCSSTEGESFINAAGAEGAHIPILFEDESIVVVNKPANMLCVPGSYSSENLTSIVAEYAKPAIRMEQMVVHRLDRHTSGLVMFAKTLPALRALHGQLRDKTIGKTYEAVVVGDIASQSAGEQFSVPSSPASWSLIDVSMVRMRRQNPLNEAPALMRVAKLEDYALHPSGPASPKEARTMWRFVEHVRMPRGDHQTSGIGNTAEGAENACCSRVELIPVTGRTHQLRLHLSCIGHPILGDPWYGGIGTDKDKDVESQGTKERMCLHARTLNFNHPETGARMEVRTPSAPF